MKNYSKALQKIKSLERELERYDERLDDISKKKKEVENQLSVYKPLLKKMDLIEKQFEELLQSVEKNDEKNEEKNSDT